MQSRFLLCSALSVLWTAVLLADPATGWLQTAAGTYDYNDPANWVNGEINGVFGSDLTLAGAQTLTVDSDTVLSTGITANFAGGYMIKFASDDTATTRMLTLGGDIVVGASTKNAGIEFTASTCLDLGNRTRVIQSTSGNATITLNAVLQNGAVELQNAGRLNLYAVNTYAGGTDLLGTGSVYVNNNALGTGSITFHQGAKLNVGGGRSFTVNNPLIMAGNWTFEGTSGSLDLGAGPISILQPLTITVTKNTLSLHGPIVEGSLSDISKAGKNGTLSTYQDIELENENLTLCSNDGVWAVRGVISGEGNVVKTGGGSLEFMTASSFLGKLIIQGGNVRFRVANAIASGSKILLEEGGLLRSNTGSECKYQYSVANIIASGIIDPASTGTLAFSSHESGDLDLTPYPDLIIGISGGNFNYSGAITASEGHPFKLGAGGNTLALTAENALTGTHDIILYGNVTFNAANDVEGTLSLAEGKTLLLDATGSLPNVDVITSTGTTVRFVATAAGTYTRLNSLTLKGSTLTMDTPSAGDVTHVITGALIADTRTTGGGVSQITGTGAAEAVSTLQVGSLEQAEGNPCFLNIAATPLGETMKVVVVNPVVALSESGTAGTVTQPILPWLRANGAILRYDANLGLVGLDSTTEQLYDEGPYEALENVGENTAILGATVAIPGDATVNSLSMRYAGTVNGQYVATNGVTQVLSGALDLLSYTSSELNGALDFGPHRGYISGRVSSQKNASLTLCGSISGTGGLSFGDCMGSSDNKTFNLRLTGSTYSGDTYVYSKVFPKSADAFPNGEDRPGNLYVYGTLELRSVMNLAMNGLYGSGTITSIGSDHSSVILGVDGSDGNFEGSFMNGGIGANFYITKEGAGVQRIASNIGLKYTVNVNAGTLQVDGSIMCGREGANDIFVHDGATLAGCGRFGGYNAVDVKSGGTLAPGSAEMPNEPMVITNTHRAVSIPLKLAEGATLRFHVDEARASQLLVSGDVRGFYEIPVVMEGDVPYNTHLMLMEAQSFEPTFRKVSGRGHLSVVETETTQQLWLTRGPEPNVIFLR